MFINRIFMAILCSIMISHLHAAAGGNSGNNGWGGGNKIDLCHVPPGNPSNARTLNVSVNALNGHFDNNGRLHNKDYLGSCGTLSCTPLLGQQKSLPKNIFSVYN